MAYGLAFNNLITVSVLERKTGELIQQSMPWMIITAVPIAVV